MVAIENNDEFLRFRSPPKECSEFKLLFIVKTIRSANKSRDCGAVYFLIKKEGVFHLVGKGGRDMVSTRSRSPLCLAACSFVQVSSSLRMKKNAGFFDLH